MAYTTPTSRSTGNTITASIWNVDLVDNIIALKNPPSDNYEANQGSDYSSTSTSFANVDATNYSLSITTTGGDVMVGFHGNIVAASGWVGIDVTMDGTRIGLDDGIVGRQALTSSVPGTVVSFVRLVTGVSAGAHTFNLQWKVSAGTVVLYAGAGTSQGDFHPQFWVREVS